MSNQQLRNPVWIGFDGEPVAGRTPTRVFVYGPKMTSQQQGELVRHYNKFCQDNSLALGQYQLRDRYMPDGTRFRMVSVNGVDTVYAWPVAPEKQDVVLFEGFVFIPYEPLAFANYSNPSEPTHRVWGSPFNEENPFGTPYEVNALSAVAIMPNELGGSAQSILMPTKKKGVEDEYKWDHYRWPSFKRPMRDIVRAGNLDWKGPPIKGLSDYPVISWYGPPSRGLNYSYWINLALWGYLNQGLLATSLFRDEVYFRGAVLAKTPFPVQGAALRVFDKKLWLVAVTFYFEEIGQEDYLNVHERLYIKQVRLYDTEPLIDYHKGSKDQSDPGLYDPETKPYGWKLLAQRTYQAANRLGEGFIGVTEAPFHGYFFNQSATEACAAVLQGVPSTNPALSFYNYPGLTVFRKQTWSVTNEGYDSVGSFSHGPYRSDLFGADYDGDRYVEATVDWIYATDPNGNDYLDAADIYIDGEYLDRLDINYTGESTYVGYLDLRTKTILYGKDDPSTLGRRKLLFFKHGDSTTQLPDGGFYTSSDVIFLAQRPSPYAGGLEGYLPHVQCATYKDFCLFSISRIYAADGDGVEDSVGEQFLYFSEGDLLEYLGENPLPENYALDALRII